MITRSRLASTLLLGAFLLLLTVGLAAQQVHVWAGLILTEVGLLALPTWLTARTLREPATRTLGWRPPADGRLGLSLNVAGALGPLASLMAMGLTLPVVFVLVLAGATYPGVGLPLSGWGDFAAALLTGAVLAPLCEETLFRGFVLQAWRPAGAHAAVWASAVAFGVFHADPVRFVPTASLGLVFGYLALYGGSIWPAVLAHGLNNGLALAAAFFFGNPDSAAVDGVSWEAMRPELVEAVRQSGMRLADGDLEQAARLALAILAGAFLVAGLVLAAAVGLALKGFARRAAEIGAAVTPPSGAGAPAVLSSRQAAQVPVAADVRSAEIDGGLPAVGFSAGVGLFGLLLRDPAAWAFVIVGLVIWGLSLGTFFSA